MKELDTVKIKSTGQEVVIIGIDVVDAGVRFPDGSLGRFLLSELEEI
jgi:hypothetical protein